jgi:predicted secreted acid phosphatase
MMRVGTEIDRTVKGGLAALFLAVLPACTTTSRAPANLDPHKQEVRAYVESGRYLEEINAVAARAKAWVEQRAAQGRTRLTIVLDLDDTLFFNWPYLRAVDFGYIHAEWERWVAEAKAPPIESVREVYRAARRTGVNVVFLTGRRETQRAATERNLQAIGCGEYHALICKPDESRATTEEFKTHARRGLVTEGRTIIANVGDQESDLAGGFAERIFKLPNPFYITK